MTRRSILGPVLRLLTAFGLGAIGACFTDSEAAMCTPGTSGCPCDAAGECVGALVCNADNNCISSACDNGTVDCPCDGGSCDAGLSCESNICQPSGGGSGSGESEDTGQDTSGDGAPGEETSGTTGDGLDGTSGETGSTGETGEASCDRIACEVGMFCNDQVLCETSPYHGCAIAAECDGGTCFASSSGAVCAPPCVLASDCPMPADGNPPVCDGTCGLSCTTDEECPTIEGMFCGRGSRCVLPHAP
ncbi:MAG: hypothetical protein AAF721_06000 [Myxococcota bacterium]